jgi:hypoxanthine phosphoribosyltransferase
MFFKVNLPAVAKSGGIMHKIVIKDKTFRTLIPYEQISEAIDKVAEQLNTDFRCCEKTPVLLCVLNGSIMFMGELMKRVNFDCQIVSTKLTSYEGTTSTGTVRQALGLTADITGRDVIIVEDIVDTGESMEHLLRSLAGHKAASVSIATLLFKPTKFTKSYEVKYRALDIPDDFIVGFGLDYNDIGRNLKDIYTIVNE